MTVTFTEHGRHADDARSADRRTSRALRRDTLRDAAAARPDGGANPRLHPEEVPPHRERTRRRLADLARRIDLPAIADRLGTPLLVVDAEQATAQLLDLRRNLPGAEIHVAAGALPHPALIRAVDAFGASFGVASRRELDALEHEGVAVGRCVYTTPAAVAELTSAYLRGIRTFVVDRPGDLDAFAGLPDDARVLVRLSLPDPDAGAGHPSFGVSSEAAPDLVGQCLRAGRSVAGFTIHVDARTTGADPWRRAIRRALKLMHALEGRFGIRFDTLDIGGGLLVADDPTVPEPAVIVRGIRDALAAAPSRYRVIVEPGRFVADPAATLVTRVLDTTTRPDGRWLHVDDGVAGAFADSPALGALVFAASELGGSRPPADEDTERVIRRLRERSWEPVTVAGPTGEPADVIARALRLPELRAGDLLVIPMAGARTWAGPTAVDGLEPTSVHVLSGSSPRASA